MAILYWRFFIYKDMFESIPLQFYGNIRLNYAKDYVIINY
jgi:hypothetical protein